MRLSVINITESQIGEYDDLENNDQFVDSERWAAEVSPLIMERLKDAITDYGFEADPYCRISRQGAHSHIAEFSVHEIGIDLWFNEGRVPPKTRGAHQISDPGLSMVGLEVPFEQQNPAIDDPNIDVVISRVLYLIARATRPDNE